MKIYIGSDHAGYELKEKLKGYKDPDLAKKIDKAIFPGFQGGPHMNNIAAKAVAFGEALRPSFKTYAKQILKNANKRKCKRFSNDQVCQKNRGMVDG